MKLPENDAPAPGKGAAHQAYTWVTRRDRGLTSSEQDAYFQWLSESPDHAEAYAQAEATLHRLEQLRHWQPALTTEPNPDLFAPPRRREWKWWIGAMGVAAAAAVALAVVFRERPVRSVAQREHHTRVVIENERRVLPDGSTIDLREGSTVSILYTEGERRVKLNGGQALFEVAKNPSRPFIVEANGVSVRAVGTAFSVQLKEAQSVEVLVTEGKVSLGHQAAPAPSSGPEESVDPAESAPPLPVVVAGERAVVSLLSRELAPVVTAVTAAEIKDELEWRKPLLQFYETPLGEAVAEFNRHNQRQLVLGDAGLAGVPIGGSFRVDNLDGFARLLEFTLGLHAQQDGAERIVLHRAAK